MPTEGSQNVSPLKRGAAVQGIRGLQYDRKGGVTKVRESHH